MTQLVNETKAAQNTLLYQKRLNFKSLHYKLKLM